MDMSTGRPGHGPLFVLVYRLRSFGYVHSWICIHVVQVLRIETDTNTDSQTWCMHVHV